ncbi:hypothetical protein [Streptomyces avidinii]|uniref:Uncharacterized protein n=1 Tax=Streptomyces avidinii TaxID=1895 RepID=A0ABS4KX87_STRAV|nr:hypothetical protein [Streptomyces avidinii]MBP2034650.1 hypothetical protein [Streptomyces avidinii]
MQDDSRLEHTVVSATTGRPVHQFSTKVHLRHPSGAAADGSGASKPHAQKTVSENMRRKILFTTPTPRRGEESFRSSHGATHDARPVKVPPFNMKRGGRIRFRDQRSLPYQRNGMVHSARLSVKREKPGYRGGIVDGFAHGSFLAPSDVESL